LTVPLSIVVAAADNDVIGADGDMPWRLSSDLKRFRKLTMGKPMIMGRKTFQSIGKPLPGRVSVVVTRGTDWHAEGAVVVNDIEQAVKLAQELAAGQGADEIVVVGGGEIYRQLIDECDTLHVTRVHGEPVGDTRFPAIDSAFWLLVNEQKIPASDIDTAATTYRIYRKKPR